MKETIKRSWNYNLIRIYQLKNEPRLIAILLLILIIMYQYAEKIRIMAQMTSEKIMPYFLPFIMSDYTIATGVLKILILIAYLLIVCHVSQKQNGRLFCFLRTGRIGGIIGDVFFTAFLTAAYCFIIWAFSILCFLPYVQLGNEWGKIICTLAYTDAAFQYGEMFVISAKIVEQCSPFYAVVLTILLMFLGCFFLGLLTYFINMVSMSNVLGIFMAGIFIFICPIVTYMRIPELYFFSPLSWMSIGSLKLKTFESLPTIGYALIMYLILIVFLLVSMVGYAERADMNDKEIN